ncbi:MAG TPA: hypothetical protein VJC17_03905 [Candidatus Dojkabacteria bacterium]|nr:hypothetical protein [Candidatus Dojkabacteria bacterium]
MDFIRAFFKENIQERKYWYKTLIFGAIVFVATAVYLQVRERSINIYSFNRLFALNAVVLIGTSYMMSGLGYFFNIIDNKIIFRKYLGTLGWAFALVHVTMSLAFYFVIPEAPKPDFEFAYKWDISGVLISNILAFFSGVFAILTFTVMAAISSKFAAHAIGGGLWRMMLRMGYPAFVLLTVHFGLKNISSWQAWFTAVVEGRFANSSLILPPLSLLAVIFIVFVVVLRIALQWSLIKKRNRLSASMQALAQSGAPRQSEPPRPAANA